RLLADDAVEFILLQFVAHRRRAAALPHDRVMNRLAARAIPDHGRLALVRNPDGCDVIGLDVGFRQGFARAIQLRVPNVFGVVFDQSRLREDCGNSCWPTLTMLPARSNRIARDEVVPWSRAKT